MSSKTIEINPSLFSVGGLSKKNRSKKNKSMTAPLISPNILKNKLLKMLSRPIHMIIFSEPEDDREHIELLGGLEESIDEKVEEACKDEYDRKIAQRERM